MSMASQQSRSTISGLATISSGISRLFMGLSFASINIYAMSTGSGWPAHSQSQVVFLGQVDVAPAIILTVRHQSCISQSVITFCNHVLQCEYSVSPELVLQHVLAQNSDRCKLSENQGQWLAGSFTASIFQLLPELQLFRPKGINKNYQWCGYNFTSASIPNGFGWGGQV